MQNYNLYNKNKAEKYKSYGKMRISEESIRAWGSIVIDWIMKLLSLRKSIINIIYNSILIITNRFIKYVYFLPYIKEFGAEEFAY